MPPKRKRSDRPSGGDGGRPSPHRPGDTAMAQHDREDGGGRGRGRGPRGGSQRRDSSQGYGRGPSNQPQTPRRSSSSSQPAAHQPPPPPPPPPPAAAAVPAQASRPQAQSNISRAVSPVRSDYIYELLTPERTRSWADRGRREIIEHGIQSREDVDITELSSLFQEFVHTVVEAKLDPNDAGACVKEILGSATSEVIKDSYAFAPHSLMLDSLATVIEAEPDLYRPTLRDFLDATGVSQLQMREVLGQTLLEQLGLVRSTFTKAGIRHATNVLYRQANYNLLREETEGYSKLITDLYSTSSSTAPPAPDAAEETFERIKALIGTFDLDVGRVLDVTLDVAASVVVKQVKFFVRLLRASSWWPRDQIRANQTIYPDGVPNWACPEYPSWETSDEDNAVNRERKLLRDVAFWARTRDHHLAAFFELGGRQLTEAEMLNGSANRGVAEDYLHRWTKETNTLPPPGNRVAAQLLGFKLRFYYSEYRGEEDVLPANLLYLVAVLCKIGFISLPDIYPHLSPDDADMDEVREDQLKVLEEEDQSSRTGPMNALARAGVLTDDDGPPSSRRPDLNNKKPEEAKSSAEKPEDKKKKPLEQKVSLLIQLLTIGAIPEALFILGRFPWIPETFPEALQRIHRLLHACLDKVYHQSQPTSTKSTACPMKQVADLDQTGLPKGTVRLSTPPAKRTNPWPYPDAINTKDNSANSWRYFWDEWADNVPVCQTVDDVFTLCNTFLNVSGVNIGKDEALLAKLASIGTKSLAEDKSDSNRARWHDLLKRLLVPALSHTQANASVVNAIWDLLRQYPTTTRYTIYAEWFEGQTSRHPAMVAAFSRARFETRATMKRISLTNLSEMAKKMAKLSFSSPGVVFKVAFEQLESYPNLIEAFVECAKYFPDLSYDVLIWSLLSSLGKTRSRTQAEHALTTSKWLQALSRFSGKIFRRYSVLDATPVLSYVNDQLLRGNSTDLIILKELVASMGGIVDSTDFTDHQVLSMAGGEYLRRHTLIRGQDKRFENPRSSRRLIHALKDSNLAARLLINLVQYRQVAIFQVPEDEAHIKLLSSLVDDSHQTLLQYLDFLWSNLEPAAFDALVPSITDLIKTYGIDVSLAFAIGRSSLVHRMFPWKAKKGEDDKGGSKGAQAEADKDGDVSMTESKVSGTADTTLPDGTTSDDQKSDDPSQIRAALQPIVDTVQELVPEEVWNKITPDLFVTFWALQLGDLLCPDKIYRQERERLKSEEMAVARDRSDMTRKGQERKMEKRKELMQLQIGLSEECGEHLLRQAKWKFNLSKQFQASFPTPGAKADSISDVLIEQCFQPRVLLSTADAEYTFRFIKALHDWNAPGFKLMSLYDRLFNASRLRSLIFTCTVREAEHFGRFLRLILEDLSRWHKNDSVPNEKDSKAAKDQPRLGAYEKEGKGPSDAPRLGFALTVDTNGKPETFVEHAQFKDLLFRWHKNLNMALKACLSGTEWMHIRNAITVLRSVLDYFPAVDFMANQFSAQLQKITKQEAASKTASEGEAGHRVDLSVAAQGAMSELQKRKSKWVMVQAFRPNTVGGTQAENDKGGSSNLRPMATEFKPQLGKNNGGKTSAEEEDGEVRDGKDSNVLSSESGRQSQNGASREVLPARPTSSARDQASRRDNTPTGNSTPGRSSTPKAMPNSNSNGARGDSSRPTNLPARPPPSSLPSKPDVTVPGHFNSDRTPRGHERRDNRDARDLRAPPREPRDARDPRDRESPYNRESRDSRDHKEPREGRLAEPERMERPREYPERGPAETSTRDGNRSQLPSRLGQGDHDRPQREPRGGRPQDRSAEVASSTAESRSTAEEPMMNPERAALFAQEKPGPPRGPDSERSSRGHRAGGHDAVEHSKPEAPARANDTPSRGPRDVSGADRDGRAHSPRRGGRHNHENGPADPSREEKHNRAPAPNPRGPMGHGHDRTQGPGGYRGERPPERDADRLPDGRQRDASAFAPRGPDAEHRTAHQDQNYGRLNPVPPSADVPSGPRSRGRGTARGGHGQQQSTPGRDGRLGGPEMPRGLTPDKQPPTGPSSSARGRRAGLESGVGQPTPSGTPSGPHPDRMRNISHAQEQTAPASTATPTGVHPDRLAQMGGPIAPPSGPQSHGHGRQSVGDRPDRADTGPGPQQAPVGPVSLPNDGIPTGPAATSERGNRAGGGRRQLAGINSTLQQAQATMPETNRGNSNTRRNQQPRQMLGGNSDAQVLTGGSPAATPNYERRDPMKVEPTSNRGPLPPNGTDAAEKGSQERGRRDRESRGDRSSRSSRRSSRERSSKGERDGKEHREHRDRRSGAGTEASTNREERESRRSGRDNAAPREPMGPPPTGRDLMQQSRESGRHRSSSGANVAREEESGAGGRSSGSGRSGQREERRGSRDDRGRKRKSEEGLASLSNDREKRQRR